MRTFCAAALVLASSCLYSYYDDECCLDRILTFQADYGYIRRQEVRDLRLVEDASILIDKNGDMRPKKKMDTDDLVERLNWESAIRGLAALHPNECFTLEVQYTYFYPWTAQSIDKGSALQFPFNNLELVHDYKDASQVTGQYKSRLQNGEINFWNHSTPQRINFFSFSWLVGVRGLNLRDTMSLTFFRSPNQSVYEVDVKNNLIGPQLGAMLEINPSRCWTWSFMIKGAGFYNRVKNDVCVLDNNNTDKIIGYKKKRTTDSWLLEAYGQLAWHLGTNFNLHFGYQGFILAGLGLAGNNRTVHIP